MNETHAADPDTVPFTGVGLPGEVIDRFTISFGGPRWLEAEYVRLPAPVAFGWRFKRGGAMTPADWPEVIARGLSYTNRFSGHAHNGRLGGYSVARHSVLMRWYLRRQGYGPGVQTLALLHDAPECVGVGDMHSRLKRVLGQSIRSYEADVLAFLLNDLGIANRLTEADHAVVHATDQAFVATEFRLLEMQNGQPPMISAGGPIEKYIADRAVLFDHTARLTQQDFLSAWKVNWAELHG